jgi:hypothetical protein
MISDWQDLITGSRDDIKVAQQQHLITFQNMTAVMISGQMMLFWEEGGAAHLQPCCQETGGNPPRIELLRTRAVYGCHDQPH